MVSRDGKRRSRRDPLSRDKVLLAAFGLADEGGLDAVTMQNVGRRLRVEAMSLYRHVHNKDDILDGLVDLVIAEIELSASADGWKSAMRARATSARDVYARHRWAIGLIESRSRPGAATLRHHESVLGTLLEAGFTSAMARHAYNLLDSYIYGFALQEESLGSDATAGQGEASDATVGELPDGEYPATTRVAIDFHRSGADYGAEFEFGLELILDGIEQVSGVAGSAPNVQEAP